MTPDQRQLIAYLDVDKTTGMELEEIAGITVADIVERHRQAE
ncbi:MAG: hypothetical protein OXH10_06330 [bacterium]|nr:hypothetical protein [bacterium]MCY3580371.1 hypothetical protein [bacterium]MCY3653159.1 hypothetical protein [bacterium]MDE0644307.1 hypothetical protein [bacterium]